MNKSQFEVQSGDILNGYKVLEFIKIYNYIYVYKVEHIESGQYFQMKMLSMSNLESDENEYHMLETFNNEMRVLASIDHPLFVKFIEAFLWVQTLSFWYSLVT